MSDWKKSVSASATTTSIRDISNYVQGSYTPSSPIDGFYEGRNQLLTAITPDFANAHPSVTPLVLVGLISLVENYFREILAGIIIQCPKAKEKSASKPLNLATAWIGYGELEKGAFENTSFSDADTIRKNLAGLIGYTISNTSQVSTPLDEFNKLCELRHAIVHSAGLLAGKNAVQLQLPSSKNSVKISVGFSELQEAAEICTSLVCAVNLELYIHISKRWLNEWPKIPAYKNKDFNVLFRDIWTLFFSNFDANNNLISDVLSPVKARNLIVKSRGV
ncbi:hypothetical protein T3H00_04765 [Pseudomonas fluorescens]|uniref:hypothetical protein n=1 Tax=Pseudomonas fluorescens TaxID=294 RepID=UPI002ACA297A|nr:hypothetical protein [Pseudomonas fluorescens]MDZ5431977.1 hypothetical protein [Pseudomonas fluorescens]